MVSGGFDPDFKELLYFFRPTKSVYICTNGEVSSCPSKWTVISVPSLVHAKLMVLLYPSHLRLIISTGNYSQIEWEQIRQARILCHRW